MAIDDTHEGRKHARVGEKLVVCAKYGKVDEFVEQITENISRGGIFIESTQIYPKGTLLKFEIKLKSGKSVMRGEGRVVWSREARPDGTSAGMGVKFTAMSKSSKALLAKILKAKTKRKSLKKKPASPKKVEPKRPKQVEPKRPKKVEPKRPKKVEPKRPKKVERKPQKEDEPRPSRAPARYRKSKAPKATSKSDRVDTPSIEHSAKEETLRSDLEKLEKKTAKTSDLNKKLKAEIKQLKSENVADGNANDELRDEIKRLKEERITADAASDDLNEEIEKLEKKAAKTSDLNKKLRAEINPLKSENVAAGKANNELRDEIKRLKEERITADVASDDLNEEIEKLRKENREVRATKEEAMADLKQLKGHASRVTRDLKKKVERHKKEHLLVDAVNEKLKEENKSLKEENFQITEDNEKLRRDLEQPKGDSTAEELLKVELKHLREEYALAGDAYRDLKNELAGLMNERTSNKGASDGSADIEFEYDSKKEDVEDACVSFTFMGEIFDVNDTVCRLTGYTKKQLVGSMLDTIEPSEKDGERIAEVILSGAVVYESTIKRRDGTELSVSVRSRVISPGNQGAIVAYYHVEKS